MSSKISSNSESSSKRPIRRSKSRSIQYRSDHGRLRLVFAYGGKHHFISLETEENRASDQNHRVEVTPEWMENPYLLSWEGPGRNV